MRILNLVLQDFRCFEAFSISFDSNFNTHIIIAENMLGKSALMSALRIAANTYTSGLKSEWQLQIQDHRIIGTNPIADISPEVSIQSTALIIDSKGKEVQTTWKKYKSKPYGERTKVEIVQGIDPRKESKRINKLVSEGKAIQPLLGFIGTEYIHVESSNTVKWDVNGKSIDGYKGCFEDKSIKKYLFNWIARIDNLILEVDRKPILAETYKDLPENAMYVFKKAVKSVLPDIREIEWSNDIKQLVVKLSNGEIRPFNMLSDGYRYLILLAGELATRAFILNKYLGKEVLEKIHGVVLIDEFGIHLHPTMQNDTLLRLQETFKNVQFIVTTHSPLLLNGLKKEQVHILSYDNEGKRISTNPDEDIIGLGADEILTKIFGLSSTMDHQFLKWNEEYRYLFNKSKESKLTPNENDSFKRLSRELSILRLDPALQLTNEDPITKIIKDNLQKYFKNKTISLTQDSTENVEKEVTRIINELFKK